jgi:hypothetical protein
MKPSLGILFLSAFLAFAAQARATVLPDACGDDKVKFDVTTEMNQPAPAAPEAGKAQIVFIEDENHMIGPFMNVTVRFGMDGAWVGATNGSSYFALAVNPGVHHLCAGWQSTLGRERKNVHAVSMTAEPGKVYYFAANVTVESESVITFGLSQLNEDEGKYRVKSLKLATSKPK